MHVQCRLRDETVHLLAHTLYGFQTKTGHFVPDELHIHVLKTLTLSLCFEQYNVRFAFDIHENAVFLFRVNEFL